MTKIVFHGDNDTNSNAEAVNAAMVKENPDLYAFVGDGPYSKTGTAWVAQQKKHFDDKKDKMIWSRGNHDEDESESKQTQKDMEAWFPEAKGVGISDCWLSSRQVGNVYVISMDTQDLDVEFKRDQFNWVTAEIAKAKQLRTEGKIDWVVALFHKPFFTLKSSHSPYTAVRFLYKDLFEEVDFGVSGHNHNTQLWYPMVPNESQANGEGKQLFTYAADGKTFDFTKPHGVLYIVSGHSGHEWNAINDSGTGVTNVQHFRDSGKFGYTSIEFDGKKAKVLSKDADSATTFEYNVTREGGTTPPPDPHTCPTGQHWDSTQNKCVDDVVTPPPPTCPQGQHWDGTKCVDDAVTPPPDPTGIICPKGYLYDKSLGECIPKPETFTGPECPNGYRWNFKTKVCDKVGTTDPDSDCPPGQHKNANGDCVPDAVTCPTGQHWDGTKCVDDVIIPPVGCPEGQCKDITTGQCRPIGTNEERDSNGNCKLKTPSGGGSVDEFGTKIPFKLTGNKVPMEVGGDPAGNGQRYNCDGKFKNYIMIGYFLIGDGQEQIEMKTDGPHHGGCKKIPVCTWWENGILCADGQGVVSSEYPHPDNHPKIIKPEFKKIGKMEPGKWIGYGVYAYQSGEFRTSGQLGTINPFGADGKPNNSWILATHMTDKGEITNEDGKNPEGPTRAVPPADGQVDEYEIRMHGESKGHGKPGGTDMKWCAVYEIENPNTEAPPNLDGTTPPPPTCPTGQHWDATQNKCVDDVVTPPPPPPDCPPGQHRDSNGNCVPDNTPPPPPTGDVLWDSNIHLKTGQAFTITDSYGDQGPDGKGVFMAASGNPRVHVDADGTFHLEADAGHGRMYIQAINYNARMTGEIMFEDDAINNTTLRLRSRHQEGGDCAHRFGGFGATVEKKDQLAEYSTEDCHNIHSNVIKKPLERPHVKGEWFKFDYSVQNSPDNKKVLFKTLYDYNDGKGWITVNEGENPNPPPQGLDEASFKERSMAWLRVNNESTGKVAYRNIKIIKI